MSTLTRQRCQACEGGIPPLDPKERERLLGELSALWQLDESARALCAEFSFRDFHAVMAFANAVAEIAHAENHHPDMILSYRRCELRWTTHAAGGLTLNDFICAAKTDALLTPSEPET